MKVSMKKMMGLFVLAVALVFLEGLLPEKRRKKLSSAFSTHQGGELVMDDKRGTVTGLISCAVILAIAVFVIATGGGL